MDILQACALFIAAALAGALNSVAGGGSFISFPMLAFTGVPEISANALRRATLRKRRAQASDDARNERRDAVVEPSLQRVVDALPLSQHEA